MIRKNQGALNVLSFLLDIILIVVAYVVATYIRFITLPNEGPSISEVWSTPYLVTAASYALVTVILYYIVGLYRPIRILSFRRDLFYVPMVNGISTLILIAVLYIFRIADFSRVAILLYFLIATIFILIKRGILRAALQNFRRLGYNQKHVVLVGNGSLALSYARSISKNPAYGFTIDGYLSLTEREGLGQHLGKYEDLEEVLANPGLDSVVIALEQHEVEHLHWLVATSEKLGVRTFIIPIFNNYTSAHLEVEQIGESKLINIRSLPLDNPILALLKRCFDILMSAIGLIVLSPFLLIVALLVKLSSPGPILFKQTRIGMAGRHFLMYKFRSMRVNTRQDTAWSTNEDDRRTRFGSWIRKFSIDELPQLFNVLKGDMSLVGPRPEIPHFVEQFQESIPLYMVKHQVRPGITGWAQIRGYRGDTSINKRIKLDIWYIENWSFDLDLRILIRTVFRLKNAESIK